MTYMDHLPALRTSRDTAGDDAHEHARVCGSRR